MKNNSQQFVDIILPLPLPRLYTYRCPGNIAPSLSIGKRVIVPFGSKKIYTGLVREMHHDPPAGYETKDILLVLDDKPVVNPLQFELWEWMASYYMAPLGDIFKAALPSGLKLESETCLSLNPGLEKTDKLSHDEQVLVEILEDKNMIRIKELSSVFSQHKIPVLIKRLLDQKIIFVEEVMKSGYKPKLESYLVLSETYQTEEQINKLFEKLQRAPAQQKALTAYLMLSEMVKMKPLAEVSRKALAERAEIKPSVIDAMVKKEILKLYKKRVSRLEEFTPAPREPSALNLSQQGAFSSIQGQFKSKDVVLLHGITSSGKTEIYIQLIKKELESGKQVLYLLPEIALTSQIIRRLKDIFGDTVGVYHSKFSDNERVEIYNNVLYGKQKLILGVRSSVFLPFSNLSLVIVDEEHENTYKQFDPSPRYHARDTAIVLGKIQQAKILLGTATPSVETYRNSLQGKYGLVRLMSRYKDITPPRITLADLKLARRKKQMRAMFTPLLYNHIKETLHKGEQVILFQNRRGFSPYLQCNVCGWVPQCQNCDVSLTYHKHLHRLVCHYCGYSQRTPDECKACGSPAMQTMGFGTEKIEDEISIIFPEAKIARMDLDTTRSKNAYERMINDFENNKVNILVGTQMVTKGLDFDNVSLVGILNADNMLNFPDFRAFERSFQLIMQVSGRAGRKNKQGEVILQTAQPEHPVIKHVLTGNFEDMYKEQAMERKKFYYPPFTRLIRIHVKHKNAETAREGANELARSLRKPFNKRVLGPNPPLVGRVQTWYIQQILVKVEKEKSLSQAKEIVQKSINSLISKPGMSGLQVIPDVDPQ